MVKFNQKVKFGKFFLIFAFLLDKQSSIIIAINELCMYKNLFSGKVFNLILIIYVKSISYSLL